MCIYICCSATNGGDGVQGSVSADAKVRARDVVGYGGRDNHNGNAHFLIFLPSLHQLKASNIRLQQKRRRRFIFFFCASSFRNFCSLWMSRRETKPSATSYLKAANDHQSVDVEFGDVLADLLQPFAWKSSSGIQDTCLFSKYKIKETKMHIFTSWCPTLNLLFQSSHSQKSR